MERKRVGPAGSLTFKKVTREDKETLGEIYNEIGAWLHDVKGVTSQWDRVAPDGLILSLIDSRETYLASIGGEPVGAVRVADEPAVGLEHWGQEALYVYSLAVRRKVGGLGVGQQILAWVEEQARGRGRTYLRLDCMADNSRLIQYYVEAGFDFLGRHPQQSWYALFEKKIA